MVRLWSLLALPAPPTRPTPPPESSPRLPLRRRRSRLASPSRQPASSSGLEEDIKLTDFVIPEILGFERGYNQRADLITQSLDGADLNVMWREFQASLALWNSKRDQLV